MKIKILQSIADLIINKLAKASDDDIIKFYYEIGIWFDGICVNYLNIYLD